MVSITEFQHRYAKAVQEGYAAVFAGAGLSRPSGFVDWKELLRDIATDIRLNVDIETDLVAVAQYYCNERGNRSRLNDIILSKFVSNGKNNRSLEILSQLPINTYWTTNYDHLIETALQKQGKRVDIKTTPQSLASVLDGRDAVIYKMHGDYTAPESCVITKDDYEAYHFSRQLFTTALQGDLVSKTFLFIGFSFDDPNLSYILSRIRTLLNENRREHYCLFEKPRQQDNESSEDYAYRANKLELKIHDLRRYGISAVLLDHYSQIPEILEATARQVKNNCIFLSGSATDYGEWGETKAVTLVRILTEKLCDHGYRIITGHGRGVGSYIISTVLEKYGNNIHEIERHLIIRAFPFQDKNRDDYDTLVKEYRTGIFQQAGIALFLFGNKPSSDGIAEAAGVLQEFELAVQAGCYIIPLGSTGFATGKIYKQTYAAAERYPYLDDYWSDLSGCTDPEQLSSQILNILSRIKKSL